MRRVQRCKVTPVRTAEYVSAQGQLAIMENKTYCFINKYFQDTEHGDYVFKDGEHLEASLFEQVHIYAHHGPPKVGDWSVCKNSKGEVRVAVIKMISKRTAYIEAVSTPYDLKDCSKILVSTDPIVTPNSLFGRGFLMKYANEQGSISQIGIEVDETFEEDTSKDYIPGKGQPAIRVMRPIVREDNTVIVKRVVELYDRGQLEKHLDDFRVFLSVTDLEGYEATQSFMETL